MIESRETTAAISQTQLLRDAGKFVFRAQPAAAISVDPLIDRGRCDYLSKLSQVSASGGLTETPPYTFSAIPGTPLRTFEGTGSIVSVLDSSTAGAANEVWLSTGARNTLGATDRVVLPNMVVGKAGVFDPGQRHPSASLMVIIPALPQTVGECWFSTEPGVTEATTRSVNTYLSKEGVEISVGSIVDDSNLLLDPAREFGSRQSRYLWIVAGLVAGLFLGVLAAMDRTEMALYRLLGATRSQAILVGFLGLLLQVCWAACVTTLTLWYFTREGPPESNTRAMLAIAAAACVAVVVGLCCRWLVSAGAISRQLKSRQ